MESYAADAWSRKLGRLLIQSNQWNYPPNAWPDAGTNNDWLKKYSPLGLLSIHPGKVCLSEATSLRTFASPVPEMCNKSVQD